MKIETKKDFEIEANKFYHKHEDIYTPEVSAIKIANIYNVEVAKVLKDMDYDMMLYNHPDFKKVIINPEKRKLSTLDGEKLGIIYGLFKILRSSNNENLDIRLINLEKDSIEYYLAKCFLLPEDLLISFYQDDMMISEYIKENIQKFNTGALLLEERLEDISSYGERGKVRLKKINLSREE